RLAGRSLQHEPGGLIASLTGAYAKRLRGVVGVADTPGQQAAPPRQPGFLGRDRGRRNAESLGQGESANPRFVLPWATFMRDPCLRALTHAYGSRWRTRERCTDRHIIRPGLVLEIGKRVRHHHTPVWAAI